MYFDAIQWILSEELQRKGNFGVSFNRIQIFPILSAVAAATKISRRRPIPIRHRLTSRPIVPHLKRNRSQVKRNVKYQECTVQPLNWNTRNVFIKNLIIQLDSSYKAKYSLKLLEKSEVEQWPQSDKISICEGVRWSTEKKGNFESETGSSSIVIGPTSQRSARPRSIISIFAQCKSSVASRIQSDRGADLPDQVIRSDTWAMSFFVLNLSAFVVRISLMRMTYPRCDYISGGCCGLFINSLTLVIPRMLLSLLLIASVASAALVSFDLIFNFKWTLIEIRVTSFNLIEFSCFAYHPIALEQFYLKLSGSNSIRWNVWPKNGPKTHVT